MLRSQKFHFSKLYHQHHALHVISLCLKNSTTNNHALHNSTFILPAAVRRKLITAASASAAAVVPPVFPDPSRGREPRHLCPYQNSHIRCGVLGLIALAFFFASGFIKTGLGNRISYQFVSLYGSSSLELGYSVVLSEAFLAPAIPSVSARAGDIFPPLVKSLCIACGSNVGDGTERRLGSWLMLTCFQASVISSSMFLTAMVANPLAANLTASTIKLHSAMFEWGRNKWRRFICQGC